MTEPRKLHRLRETLHFTFEDLEQNRNGYLSDSQMELIQGKRALVALALGGMLACFGCAATLEILDGEGRLVGTLLIGMLFVGTLVLHNGLTRSEMTTRRVERVPLDDFEFVSITREDRIVPGYIFRAGKEQFTVDEPAYRAIEAEATEAIYVAKHTRTVVSAE